MASGSYSLFPVQQCAARDVYNMDSYQVRQPMRESLVQILRASTVACGLCFVGACVTADGSFLDALPWKARSAFEGNLTLTSVAAVAALVQFIVSTALAFEQRSETITPRPIVYPVPPSDIFTQNPAEGRKFALAQRSLPRPGVRARPVNSESRTTNLVRNMPRKDISGQAECAGWDRVRATQTRLYAGGDGAKKPETSDEKRVVMKFGGSSLADADRIKFVCKLIKDQMDLGLKPIIVCSAMGKTTNALLEAANIAIEEGEVKMDKIRDLHFETCDILKVDDQTREEVAAVMDDLEKFLMGVSFIKELSPSGLDRLVSHGERSSVRLVAHQLRTLGIKARAYNSWDLGMITTGEHGNAEVLKESYGELGRALARVEEGEVPIVTGFIGKDKQGSITTLGRGGSDLTASVLGKAANLDEIQVWKDVNGIMTADPRKVPSAMPVGNVTYEEAAELAYFGAQVLHPVSMLPAMAANIPVRVRNSYNPGHSGTLIVDRRDMSESLVTAITSKDNVQVVDIVSTRMLGSYGFMSRVFEIFEANKVSVDVVATSEVSISCSLEKTKNKEGIEATISALQEFSRVELKEEKAIISLIANVQRSNEVLAVVFSVLASEDINVKMLSQGASKVNISFAVDSKDLDRAVIALHRCFFEDVTTPTVRVQNVRSQKVNVE